MASPWSPVSLEDEDEEVEEVDGAAIVEQQSEGVQQEEAKPREDEASAQRRNKNSKKRARSEGTEVNSSTNPSSSRKSEVWKDFKIISPEGAPEVAECLHCKRKFTADSKNAIAAGPSAQGAETTENAVANASDEEESE
nr:unnamed protein product [Digitaria exilis]